MSNPIVNFALRGSQAVFAAVVLGLSVTLCKDQIIDGTLPASLGYVAFVGGISFVAAFIGVASTWVELLQGVIGAGIDAFILVLNLAGGILIAVKLKGVDCSNTDIDYRWDNLFTNDLLNGGCIRMQGGKPDCAYSPDLFGDKLNSRCKQNQADSAFMFLTAIVLIAAVTLTLLHSRK